MAQLFVVMGVSGSGKSSVGQALAERLGCPFYDADDFHPPANVAKMASGTPLNDADRAPWLARLAELLGNHGRRGETAVLACSALKHQYREQLRVCPEVQFVYLAGSFDLIWQRISGRSRHYMKANMLRSQFDTLEPPTVDEALHISINQDVEAIVDQIRQASSSETQGDKNREV